MKRLMRMVGSMPVPNARFRPSGSSCRYLGPKTKRTPTSPKSAPDAKGEGESGLARDDRAKAADGYGVGAGTRLYRFGRRAHGRAAHHAAALARADERAAVAAHSRSPRARARVC